MADNGPNGLIARVAHEMKRSVNIDPSFDMRVMSEVRAVGSAGPLRRLVAWWTRPRQLSLSPVGMVALAAVLALVVALSPVRFGDAAPENVARDDGSDRGTRSVRFALEAPRANSVTLTGDFNDWDNSATPMVRDEKGAWTTTVDLRPGRYKYSFIVDGDRWIPDPGAPPALADDFGGASSMITVPEV